MTAGAAAADPGMIESCGVPVARRVTGAAFLRGLDMRRRLADRADTVVTAGTVLRGGAVIEPGDMPILGGMAGVAVGRGLHVRGRDPCCPDIIMAAAAILRRTHESAIEMAAFA